MRLALTKLSPVVRPVQACMDMYTVLLIVICPSHAQCLLTEGFTASNYTDISIIVFVTLDLYSSASGTGGLRFFRLLYGRLRWLIKWDEIGTVMMSAINKAREIMILVIAWYYFDSCTFHIDNEKFDTDWVFEWSKYLLQMNKRVINQCFWKGWVLRFMQDFECRGFNGIRLWSMLINWEGAGFVSPSCGTSAELRWFKHASSLENFLLMDELRIK